MPGIVAMGTSNQGKKIKLTKNMYLVSSRTVGRNFRNVTQRAPMASQVTDWQWNVFVLA